MKTLTKKQIKELITLLNRATAEYWFNSSNWYDELNKDSIITLKVKLGEEYNK